MFKIENGKLQIHGVAFSLPQNFFIQEINQNSAKFTRGDLRIEIGVEDSPASVETILKDNVGKIYDYAPASEVFPISRAGKNGYALFACAHLGTERYLEERFALDNNKQLFIVISQHGQDLFGKCDEVISQKVIQDFLNAIE